MVQKPTLDLGRALFFFFLNNEFNYWNNPKGERVWHFSNKVFPLIRQLRCIHHPKKRENIV